MSFNVSGADYKTIIPLETKQVEEAIHALMSNSRNRTRLIGLDTISIRTSFIGPRKTSIAVLQLCDESQCLIIKLASFGTLPESLYNFLSLPCFTFVGFGIKEAMSRLWKEHGIVCKNTLEARPSVGQSTLSCVNAVDAVNAVVRSMHVPPTECISVSLCDPFKRNLSEDLIKLAVSNAKAALEIGHTLLYPNGIRF